MLPVVFRPLAEAEALEAHAWYAEYSSTTSKRFFTELSAAIGLIAERPLAFQQVHGEIRRVVLRHFPYALYYRVASNTVVVLAVHGRQDPARWQGRT